jgi:hypothetical protein
MNDEQCDRLVEAIEKLTGAVLTGWQRQVLAQGGPVSRGRRVVLEPGETLVRPPMPSGVQGGEWLNEMVGVPHKGHYGVSDHECLIKDDRCLVRGHEIRPAGDV